MNQKQAIAQWNERMGKVTDLLAQMAPIAFVAGREDLLNVVVNVFRVLDAANDAINTGQPITDKLVNKLLGQPDLMEQMRRTREKIEAL